MEDKGMRYLLRTAGILGRNGMDRTMVLKVIAAVLQIIAIILMLLT